MPKPVRCSASDNGSRILVTCQTQANTTAYRLNRETGSENLRRLKAKYPDVIDARLLVRATGESLLVSERTYERWSTDYYVDQLVEMFGFPHPDAVAAGAHAVVELRSGKGLKGKLGPPGRITKSS